MPKRRLDHLDDILPFKKRKLSGDVIYKSKGFFGESLIIGFNDICVNPKCKNPGFFGESLIK